MPLAKLRKMETMYKKEYINAVMDEHDEVGKYFLWVMKFTSLNELIDYHKRNTCR